MSGQLKEVRDRIVSVKNTMQITKAMKMVSAAKLRRAQQSIIQLRPYADKLNEMLRNILSNLEGDTDTQFGEQRTVQNVCLVVVTSNRGLAGAFNTNIGKLALKKVRDDYAAQHAAGKLSMVFIGKKGYEYVSKRIEGIDFITDHLALFDDLSFDNVARISQQLMDTFQDKELDKIDVVYGKFKNALVQTPTVHQFLPVEKLEIAPETDDQKQLRANYIFEPGQKELLDYLVPTILQIQFQKCLLDTHAAEHGARMTAMDNATENAKELLRDLKISYNKARQEAITKEILEIVGGAAALEDG